MYRTDKQFMKNPATANSRIYIGGIPKAIIAEDLEVKFSNHGKILGLVINSGFAFIQYELEQEAQNAIRAENGTLMIGRKITVRQAFAGKEGISATSTTTTATGPQQRQPNSVAQVAQNLQQRSQQQQIIAQNELNPLVPSLRSSSASTEGNNLLSITENEPVLMLETQHQENQEDGIPELSNNNNNNRTIPQAQQQQIINKFNNNEDRSRKFPRGGRNNRKRDQFDPPNNSTAVPYFDDYGPQVQDIGPPPERNDCEIIVVSRTLTEYAEFIESRLKHIGLIVDLLFPNEDVAIGKVLANISSRGCLYAILVMPQNEEHRSLTLNILHGIPQEHRNMPLDDVFLLIQRNFEAYMRGEKAPEDPVKMSLADRHPVPIQMLLNLLAENRLLSTSQYDRVLKYLQERRELQREHEISEGINTDSNEKNKQNDLQNRIMNILNKTNDTVIIPTSITSSSVPQKPFNTHNSSDQELNGPTPLLKDPSVQKALDSILTGDMFKNL